MWPSNSNRGTSIDYGHNGSGIYVPQRQAQPWLFARTKGNGFLFHNIDRTTVVEPNLQLEDHRPVGDDRYTVDSFSMRYTTRHIFPDVFIPSHLVMERFFESENISAARGYDVSWGDLLSAHKNGQVAYADGRNHTSVCIGRLGHERVRVGSEEDSWTARIPVTADTQSVKVTGNVKQVRFQDAEDEFSEFLLARTELGLSLIHGVGGEQVLEEDGEEENEGEDEEKESVRTWQNIAFIPHSHESVCVNSDINPFFSSQLVAFYNDKTWKIWNVESAKPREELSNRWQMAQIRSNYHAVKWGHDSHSVLIGDRINLKLFDLRSTESQNVLSVKKNMSQMCDVQRSTTNTSEIFILTTDKVIWKDLRNPGPNLLDWTHYLNARDPSLKLCNTSIDQVEVLSVYSAYQPANVVFQFSRNEGLPISAEDPFAFTSDPSVIGQTCQLVPIHSDGKEMMASLKFGRSYGVTADILCVDERATIKWKEFDSYEDYKMVHGSKDYRRNLEQEQQQVKSLTEPGPPARNNPFLTRPAVSVRNSDFRSNYNELVVAIEKVVEKSPVLELGELAKTIGERIAQEYGDESEKIVTMTELLGDVYTPAQLATVSLRDLDLMLEELADHYQKTLIGIEDSISNLKSVFGIDEPVSTQNVFNHLVSLYVNSLNEASIHESLPQKRLVLCKYMAIEMRLSMLRIVMRSERHIPDQELLSGVERFTGKPLKHVELRDATTALLKDWGESEVSDVTENQLTPGSAAQIRPSQTMSQRQTRFQMMGPGGSQARRAKRRRRNEGFG